MAVLSLLTSADLAVYFQYRILYLSRSLVKRRRSSPLKDHCFLRKSMKLLSWTTRYLLRHYTIILLWMHGRLITTVLNPIEVQKRES